MSFAFFWRGFSDGLIHQQEHFLRTLAGRLGAVDVEQSVINLGRRRLLGHFPIDARCFLALAGKGLLSGQQEAEGQVLGIDGTVGPERGHNLLFAMKLLQQGDTHLIGIRTGRLTSQKGVE